MLIMGPMIVALAAVVALASTRERVAIASERLADAGGVAELKSWFNAQRGHPRVILLLSPT